MNHQGEQCHNVDVRNWQVPYQGLVTFLKYLLPFGLLAVIHLQVHGVSRRAISPTQRSAQEPHNPHNQLREAAGLILLGRLHPISRIVELGG